MLMSIVFAALSPFLENVTAPVEVAVPPTYAARDLCRLDNGEIRHYGRKLVNGEVRTVYIASTDGYNWSTHLAERGDVGAMQKIPWSGTWFALKGGYVVGRNVTSLRCYRSKLGPGDVKAEMKVVLEAGSYEFRQVAFLPDRRRIVCALSDTQTFAKRGNSCYHATVMYSDDDAKSWKMVDVPAIPDVPRFAPGDKMPHWFNDGCEPSLVAMKDGSLRMMVRTSGPYAGFLESTDGGESWRVLPFDRRFWQANTMPLLTRLRDGRLLAVWNNTAMLPTRDSKEYPELGKGELSGEWETVFTNRDALHAAISDDDGRTWKGFRELILSAPRNHADFRQLGNAQDQEHDKSVHQTQLLELDGGKILLALGQNAAARRLIMFDPNWLLERGRRDDFRHGFEGLSNHLYVRSLAGGARGWAGHCAFNRVPGALLVRDPDGTKSTRRELLQLCRIRDPRLISDRQGIVWNFPSAEKGVVELDVRIAKSGFRLTLADHWMNPCDETGPGLSPFTCEVTRELIGAGWCRLSAEFDGTSRKVKLAVNGKVVKELAYTGDNPAPISYLHLQTLAVDEDPEGTYFRSFEMKALDNSTLRLFVGCSTNAKNPNGLHAVELDTVTGKAKVVASYPVANATYQSFSPDGAYMYSVTSGGLASFRLEGERLIPLDRHDCGGSPCHVSTMPDGSQVNWADYGKGTAGSVKVKDGRFVGGAERYVHGAKSHCHQAMPTPDGRRFCVVDLGLDSITTYPGGKVFHTEPTGAGPRHMVFHRNGRLAFTVFELGNLLASYRWDAEGGLSPLDSKATIPGGDGRRNNRDYASAIRFTPDGRRLVVTNRGEESLVVFDFDERTGALSPRSRTKLPGSWPRDFAFVTSELGMVTMERTGQVHTVRYDAEKGEFALVSTLEGFFRPASISLPSR